MIIAVASGKGGTGKTMIATSLALALKEYENVQLLDCDVEEPNDHIFLKSDISLIETVGIAVPQINEKLCNHCGLCAKVCQFHALVVLPNDVLILPNLCHGCGACAYLCPKQAITEVERKIGALESFHEKKFHFVQGKLDTGEAMSPPVIRKVKKKIGRQGVTIIDAPPGTSCPVIESIKGSDFCILVTEPTPFGLNDLVLAVETVKTLNIPCGVIINRVGTGNVANTVNYCLKNQIPILMNIPLDIDIAREYSKGITLVEAFPQWKASFISLFEMIQEMIGERNRSHQR
jgi:MinD superfamily P-loop ATPase